MKHPRVTKVRRKVRPHDGEKNDGEKTKTEEDSGTSARREVTAYFVHSRVRNHFFLIIELYHSSSTYYYDRINNRKQEEEAET